MPLPQQLQHCHRRCGHARRLPHAKGKKHLHALEHRHTHTHTHTRTRTHTHTHTHTHTQAHIHTKASYIPPPRPRAQQHLQYMVHIARFMPHVEVVRQQNVAFRRLYIRGDNGKVRLHSFMYCLMWQAGASVVSSAGVTISSHHRLHSPICTDLPISGRQ